VPDSTPTPPPSGGTLRDILHANRTAGPTGVAALGRPTSGGMVQLPLDQLEPNPWQYRSEDAEWVEELAASIAEKGQIEAITFRTTPDGKRQIIGGHTRWLALKLLRERATSEEKARYSTILANEKLGVSDEQMEEYGIIDNLLRKDPSVVDTARAIGDFQDRYSLTIEELARRFTLERDRAKRLLALNRASDHIKRGVREGVMVQLYDEETGKPLTTPQGRAKREHRHLDLMQALELASLQAFLERNQPKRAAKRIEQLITRILEEGWTFRQVQAECKKEKERVREQPAPDAGPDSAEASGEGEGRGAGPAPEPSGPILFRWQDEGRLLVYTGRLTVASSERRAELRAELEKVLAALQ
jgi:ParB/RepB/Spo0J family partition protein